MRLRWAVHKSHAKKKVDQCKLADHLIKFHKNENPQHFLKVTVLEQTSTLKETLENEKIWTRRLFVYWPTGLNVREEQTGDAEV